MSKGGEQFCCTGCQTVFQILQAKKVQGGYQNHPLFNQALDAGILSNPELLKKKKSREPGQKLYLQIENMWCASCAQLIELVLEKTEGVKSCAVDYATDMAVIEYCPQSLSKEMLCKAIEKLGYEPSSLLSNRDKKSKGRLFLRMTLSLCLFLYLMMFSYPLYVSSFGVSTEGYEKILALFSLLLATSVITYVAAPIWKKVYFELRLFRVGMYTLVLLAVSSAYLYSMIQFFKGNFTHLYFDSMAATVALIFVGRWLESRVKHSTKEKVVALMRHLPKRARRKNTNGTYTFVSLKEVAVGATLCLLPGERVALDGVVVDGEATLDESMMTGEMEPVFKKEGDSLIAATCLQTGKVHYRVTQGLEESLLKEMIGRVEHSLATRGPGGQIFDRFAAGFVCFTLILALASYLLFHDILRTLSILLISCPCIIGIARPLVHSFLLRQLTKWGLVVKNPEQLMRLKEAPFFVFDKTGTLTEGNFRVVAQEGSLDGAVIKRMVQGSLHPIAQAMDRYFACEPAYLSDVVEEVGKGFVAAEGEHHYCLGSRALMEQQGCTFKFTNDAEDQTTHLYFSVDKQTICRFRLADRLRNQKILLDAMVLSGDRREVVEKITTQVGLCHFLAEQSPQDKQREIERLKKEGRLVVMVGDGINDTIAMASADLSIAMAHAAPMALEVADCVFTSDSLNDLGRVSAIVQKARHIFIQNISWAFCYNGIGLGLALAGLLTPLAAALFMVCSSLVMTLNTLRLRGR